MSRLCHLPLLWIIVLIACQIKMTDPVYEVSSPSGEIKVHFLLDDTGSPKYMISHKGRTVIDTSGMGFIFKDQDPMSSGMRVLDTRLTSTDESWEMPWGEQREVRNHYNALSVFLRESTGAGRTMTIVFRVFDDGVGFRYELGEQGMPDSAVIMDELTQFRLSGDHLVWWQPGDWDIYEHLYNTTR